MDQTAPVFWKACVRSEVHSGGSMGWEGNRKRLLHGADGTNLYSGGGILNSSLLARGNLCIGVLHRKDRQYLC